jgi:hypothetical protein
VAEVLYDQLKAGYMALQVAEVLYSQLKAGHMALQVAEVLYNQLKGVRNSVNVTSSLHLTYVLLGAGLDNPFCLSNWHHWSHVFPTLGRRAHAVAQTVGITEVSPSLPRLPRRRPLEATENSTVSFDPQ